MRNKKIRNALIIIAAIAVIITLSCILLIKLYECYWIYKFNSCDEYESYVTNDGKYTVSLRDDSNIPGLMDAVILRVYLINNSDGKIKYIDKGRIDFYDDFTPYTTFTEHDNAVVVTFHRKYSTHEVVVECK